MEGSSAIGEGARPAAAAIGLATRFLIPRPGRERTSVSPMSTGEYRMRAPRPTSATLPVHFFWLFAAAVFLFAGVVWSGSKAHAEQLSPAAAAQVEAAHDQADREVLLGKLQLAGIASRRAGPELQTVTARQPAIASPDAQQVALARYANAVGPDSDPCSSSSSRTSTARVQRVLDGLSDRPSPAPAGGDVASGRVDPRGSSPSCSTSPKRTARSASPASSRATRASSRRRRRRRRRKIPPHLSAHLFGHAVDISSLGGIPILGNQQPGGVTERAIERDPFPSGVLQPRQVISLLDLSGPSFRLPDHYNHIHVGY